MKFNEQSLKDELANGLLEYERDTNLSPFSVVESLIEKFLFKKGYLSYGAGDNKVSFPCKLNQPRFKYTRFRKNGKLQVRKQIGGKVYNFGICEYGEAEMIIEFLKSKNWDIKYSTFQTKLRSKKQIEFLLNEIEKENELKETE